MKQLTMPQAVLILGVLAILAWSIMQWPDRYHYRVMGENSASTVRINKWTGTVELSILGQPWKQR